MEDKKMEDKEKRIEPVMKVIQYNENEYSEKWEYNDKLHREDGPAYIYYRSNIVIHEEWFYKGKNRRDSYGPTITSNYKNGNPKQFTWFNGYEIYNEISFHKNGMTKREIYYSKGRIHRDKKPAIIEKDELGRILKEEYYKEGTPLKMIKHIYDESAFY